MKRELNKQEKELTEKGIKNCKDQLISFNKELEMTIDYFQNIENKRKFEDKWRHYNREKEDKQIIDTISGYKEQIKMTEEKIKVMKNHLKEGVEIKNSAVN